ncbi:MAG TPA: hypothetical protein VKR58_04510 [Aquella sp.]|nr:hypothetical protein [Aquella sp.]
MKICKYCSLLSLSVIFWLWMGIAQAVGAEHATCSRVSSIPATTVSDITWSIDPQGGDHNAQRFSVTFTDSMTHKKTPLVPRYIDIKQLRPNGKYYITGMIGKSTFFTSGFWVKEKEFYWELTYNEKEKGINSWTLALGDDSKHQADEFNCTYNKQLSWANKEKAGEYFGHINTDIEIKVYDWE